MKVIVVDDESLVLKVETAVISNVLADAEVIPFKSAESVLEYAQKNRIDIAFLDIQLRGSTGLDLAKRLSVQ